MKKELMDKEVLCIIDTRQIQKFMFRSNSYIDTLGGSDLIIHILPDAISYALHNIDTPLSEDEYDLSLDPDAEIPYFSDEKCKFQLIINSAGNALCIVRTGELCQKIIRKISRYFLDKSYSLNIAVSVIEKTDNFGVDIFNLYKELNENKASAQVSDPVGALAIIRREKRTGNPVISFDENLGDYISEASYIRRNEASKREHFVNIDDINKTRSEGKDYLAVIHADGNNLGITIGRILQATHSYEDGIRSRRMINRNITESYGRIIKETVSQLKEYYLNKTKTDDFAHEFQIIHQAGDDINCICNASMVFPFVEILYKNLKGNYIWNRGDLKVPLSVCTGVAFVTSENGFHSAFSTAEKCCRNAKLVAKEEKNLHGEYAGNWIDFQICDKSHLSDIDMLRKQFYVMKNGINLMLRPYSFDIEKENEVFFYDSFMERVKYLRNLHLDDKEIRMLKMACIEYTDDFSFFIKRYEQLKEQDLSRFDENPLYREQGMLPRSIWYDAIEVMNFVTD